VGVAALSGHADREALELGLEGLRALGFEPVQASNLRSSDGPFAGDDRARLEGFHELVADPDLKAIFFLRGGHGVLRLLDAIDWDLLARHPRAYVGYSDLTPLLLQIVSRLDLVAIHGPMVAVELARGLDPEERENLLTALAGEGSLRYPLAGPGRGPVVEAPLYGGCLSLLAATAGTEFAAGSHSGILFWEDIDEPFYRIDRMLTQLRLSGSVSTLSGMVIGQSDLQPEEFERLQSDFQGAFVAGLSSGHCTPNLPLPLGAMAKLDPSRQLLEIELSS
jgi:muramoyltetrapeptide carboxypeptidase